VPAEQLEAEEEDEERPPGSAYSNRSGVVVDPREMPPGSACGSQGGYVRGSQERPPGSGYSVRSGSDTSSAQRRRIVAGSSCGPSSRSGTPRSDRNFIAENRNKAVNSRPRSSSVPKAQEFARDESNVPLYLQRVKRMIAQEERMVADRLGLNRNDNAPPGHRWLPEDERLEILSNLQARKKTLDAQHMKLPLCPATEGQRRRANDLEVQLREADEMIKQFSRERILVKL